MPGQSVFSNSPAESRTATRSSRIGRAVDPCPVRRTPGQGIRMLRAGHGPKIVLDDVRGRPVTLDAAIFQAKDAATNLADARHIVADENHGPPMVRHFLHFPQALLLKAAVSHRQDFVDDQNIRLEVGGHGESQPHIHARGEAFDRGVQEHFRFGKADDFVEFALDLDLGHAEDGPVQENVLAAGQFRMESGSHLQQAGHPPLQLGPGRTLAP